MSRGQQNRRKSLLATMAVKDAVNRAYETTMAEGINYERRLFQSLFATEIRRRACIENANRNFATSKSVLIVQRGVPAQVARARGTIADGSLVA
jgi:hypothetical protein